MKRRSAVFIGLIALAFSPVTVKQAQAQTVNCTGVVAWSGNSVVYSIGNLVTYQGSEFKCQQAHTSNPSWDPIDAASLWINMGTCASTTGTTTTGSTTATCSTKPNAPTGLAASGTTSTGTNLSWSAVTPPANCSISGYTVYKAGVSIGTATGTTFSVTGLSASTTYSFTVAATDAAGTGVQGSSINVTTSASGTGEQPFSGTPVALPGTVQAENYDKGGEGVGYHMTSTNGSDNGYRTDGIDLEVCTDTGGGVNTGWTAAGQWTRYTVSVATAGTYTATFRVANGATASGSFHLANSAGTNLSGAVNVAVTGGWQTWVNVTANVTLPAGTQVLTIAQDSANFNVNYVSFASGGTSCTTKAAVPGGLAASGTTSSSTNLTWSSVGAPANCSISGYAVYKGGAQIATVSSGTSFGVTGLSPSTAYSFTVASIDGAGTSAQSAAVNVTTSAGSTAGPIKNAVIGYWDNWGTFTMPNTSMNYKVINYAFAVGSGTDGATMVMWTPSATNPLSSAAADIAATKAQGRSVILSLGGATSPNITLLNSTDVNNFVSSVENLVNTYGFQGIDLDFENSSVTVNAGDSLTNPTTPDIANMSSALHQLKSHYGSSFIITYVPETADIDAYAAYGGLWGGYLALIGATRDIMTFCDTQCYNSGSMNAANGAVVSAGTADFLVAMSELLLHGYTISGGQNFAPISPSQVAFGNLYNGTASSSAVAAYKYLTTGASDGGSYHLLGGPYPNMAGVMIWDINGDATNGYAYSTALKNGGLTGN